ncbi:hypothetical protein [Mucilaginibacter panaciglaebae]|uniref:Uncharacterized protein n=1 Tax=Mucilaginibacter panaciglaebae TaxID=502331 RepID=A0ABP7WIN4_9SPHI
MINSNEQALAADAQHLLNDKVNMFLFDLKNEATEHGFKSGESWSLHMATDDEITDLKRSHHLVVSMRFKPTLLLQAYQQVKNGIQQSVSKTETELSVNDLIREGKQYIAAYPVRIPRK